MEEKCWIDTKWSERSYSAKRLKKAKAIQKNQLSADCPRLRHIIALQNTTSCPYYREARKWTFKLTALKGAMDKCDKFGVIYSHNGTVLTKDAWSQIEGLEFCGLLWSEPRLVVVTTRVKW